MKIFRIISLSALGLFLAFSACLAFTIDNGVSTGGEGASTAYEPSASPVAGTYTSSQSVSLSASGADSIRYTVDGSTPSCTSGTVYSAAITVGSTQTIKAISCYDDNNGETSSSNVASLAYTINISSGGSSGGGGGASVTYCSSLIYSDWGSCINGSQFRSVLSRIISGCSLSTAQQLSLQQTCVADLLVVTEPEQTQEQTAKAGGSQTSDLDIKAITSAEKALVLKVNNKLSSRLAGRILLQVEGNGEAWFVEPLSLEKHFMGRPADAFSLMRRFGLGISNANFDKFEESGVPAKFAGRIFLKVEANGEAYYVDPVDLKMHYLGRPEDAFNLMRSLALGISNDNLRQIQVGD